MPSGRERGDRFPCEEFCASVRNDAVVQQVDGLRGVQPVSLQDAPSSCLFSVVMRPVTIASLMTRTSFLPLVYMYNNESTTKNRKVAEGFRLSWLSCGLLTALFPNVSLRDFAASLELLGASWFSRRPRRILAEGRVRQRCGADTTCRTWARGRHLRFNGVKQGSDAFPHSHSHLIKHQIRSIILKIV